MFRSGCFFSGLLSAPILPSLPSSPRPPLVPRVLVCWPWPSACHASHESHHTPWTDRQSLIAPQREESVGPEQAVVSYPNRTRRGVSSRAPKIGPGVSGILPGVACWYFVSVLKYHSCAPFPPSSDTFLAFSLVDPPGLHRVPRGARRPVHPRHQDIRLGHEDRTGVCVCACTCSACGLFLPANQ